MRKGSNFAPYTQQLETSSAPEQQLSDSEKARNEARAVLRGSTNLRVNINEVAKNIISGAGKAWAATLNGIDSPERHFWKWRERVNSEKVANQEEKIRHTRFAIVRKARQAKLNKAKRKLKSSAERHSDFKGMKDDRIKRNADKTKERQEAILTKRKELITKKYTSIGRSKLNRAVNEEMRESKEAAYSKRERKLVINTITLEQYREFGRLARHEQSLEEQKKSAESAIKRLEDRKVNLQDRIKEDTDQHMVKKIRYEATLPEQISSMEDKLVELEEELELEDSKANTSGMVVIGSHLIKGQIDLLNQELEDLKREKEELRDELEALNESIAQDEVSLDQVKIDLENTRASSKEKLQTIKSRQASVRRASQNIIQEVQNNTGEES